MSTKWSHPAIDALNRRLDDISADIKGLEEYLQHSALRERVVMGVPSGGNLAWTLVEPDRWRLAFEAMEYRCALIETKAAVRLRVAPLLPEFLNLIGEHVARLGDAMSDLLCRCGHTHSEHQHPSGFCVGETTRGRHTCACPLFHALPTNLQPSAIREPRPQGERHNDHRDPDHR